MAQSMLVYCAALATLREDHAAVGFLGDAIGQAEHWIMQAQLVVSDQLRPELSHLLDQPVILLLAIGLGLALWLLGDRLIKPVVLLLGILAVAALSMALVRTLSLSPAVTTSPTTPSTIAPASTPSVPVTWLAIGVGAMLGLMLSKGIHRLVITLSTALTSAGLAGVLTAVVLTGSPVLSSRVDHQPLQPRPETMAEVRAGPPAASAPTRSVSRIVPVAWSAPDASPSPGQNETSSAHAMPATNPPASMLWHSMVSRWNGLPVSTRRLIAAAAMLGSCLGLFFGFFRPRHSAPIAAALAGSLLWLGASAVLSCNIGLTNAAGWLHSTVPAYGLGLWLMVAAVGFWFQCRQAAHTH